MWELQNVGIKISSLKTVKKNRKIVSNLEQKLWIFSANRTKLLYSIIIYIIIYCILSYILSYIKYIKCDDSKEFFKHKVEFR